MPIDLRGVEGPPLAVAVDTKRPYQELPIGVLEPGEHRWEAPYESDWVVAVREF